jgi:hypothetical protein
LGGVASSGLRPSRAVPNGMTPERGDPINRPGDNASRCCPGASSVKQLRAALRATWRRGDDRHERCNQITRVGRACQEDGTSAEYFLFQAVRFHPPVASSRVPIHIDRRILGLTLCSDRSGSVCSAHVRVLLCPRRGGHRDSNLRSFRTADDPHSPAFAALYVAELVRAGGVEPLSTWP